MTFKLSDPLGRASAVARFRHLLERGSVIELTEKTMRTPSQNRYLHLIIGVLAMETGNTLEYAKDMYFKRIANRDLFVYEREDRLAGRVEVLRSSRDLSVEQMSLAIDRFKTWASQQGIYLPNPEDLALLQDIEVEMGRCAKFL